LFKNKKGKEIFYAFSDEERDAILGKEAQKKDELLAE
jgi:hypothetical protein